MSESEPNHPDKSKRRAQKSQIGVAGSALVSLGQWFDRSQRILPWRERPEPYRVWVSEIMLQQTQVITVIPFFEKFVARFPTVETLAKAESEDVMSHWAGLGYYSRARNLHQGAKQIIQGRMPSSREEWLEVPGVGPYTAGAISSIAHGQVEPILDGNVERVISRLRRMSDFGTGKRRLWGWSEALVRLGARVGVEPSNLNQALMELGATICTPQKPGCLSCPVEKICLARRRDEAILYPPKKKRKEWKQVSERTLCLRDTSGRILLRRRAEGEWRAGLWDFPEVWPKQLGLKSKWEKCGEVETKHIVTNHKISRVTEIYQAAQRSMSVAEVSDFHWVDWMDPLQLPLGNAAKKTIRAIGKATDWG